MAKPAGLGTGDGEPEATSELLLTAVEEKTCTQAADTADAPHPW